jgi:hypothetical protein
MQVEIVDGDAAGIRRVRYTFEKPVDDPSDVLLAFRDGVLRRFVPPAVGQSVESAASSAPWARCSPSSRGERLTQHEVPVEPGSRRGELQLRNTGRPGRARRLER